MPKSPLLLALTTAGLFSLSGPATPETAEALVDPLLQGGALCGPSVGGQPALLKHLIVAATETAPFQPVPSKPALGETPRLYNDLGSLHFKVSTHNRKAQAFFDQGLILAFGFNHAEAQRAFREAQKLDPQCAIRSWTCAAGLR